ncbi:MAG: sugar kinase [Clostridium sp.]|mgnify:CR=1 FL=1|uniref:sugar kinase n=1 Tax=Clostridium sp. TaxID=1506 RepID=UPI0025C6688B|nr:sugar kinase [Clostridium sp.]MCF0147330.1 sugar kinase [Clostridium sp.]
MKVVALGEILLRLATKKGVLISNTSELNVNYGGGETNVLISLSNFGIETGMISRISQDSFGDGMLSYLRSKAIDTTYISRGEGRTPIYFLEVGSGNRNSKVIYDRKNSAFSSISEEDVIIEKALKDVDIFHFSGITLAISDEVRKLTFKILEYCRENNILVSYDSNYRAKMWSLQEASKFTKKVLPYVNILSAGILDAENILNMNCNIEEKYKKLNYYYNEITKDYPNIKHIFSSFREIKSASVNMLQCNYYTNNKLYSSRTHEIDDIVDRVGGGDALTSGILYGILRKKSPEYISEFAVVASVLKHSIYGDANLVTSEEVENQVNYGVGKISR